MASHLGSSSGGSGGGNEAMMSYDYFAGGGYGGEQDFFGLDGNEAMEIPVSSHSEAQSSRFLIHFLSTTHPE